MEGVRAWIVRYKKMLILMGAAGMMLAPFFMAVLSCNSVSDVQFGSPDSGCGICC